MQSFKQQNLFTKRARTVKAAQPSESEIQAAFFVWLRVHENRFPALRFCFAVPNGGFRFKATAAAMKRTGTKAGVPDVFLPVARNGFHGLWIEFKTDGGKLSDTQKTFREFLMSQNYKFLVFRKWQTAANAVIDYLSLPISKMKDFDRF